MTGPSQTRQSFLDAADAVVDLLNHPSLDPLWEEPSVLPGFTVGGLAAHLGRAVLLVREYLAVHPTAHPVAPLVTAGEYFALAVGIDDRASSLSQGVLARGHAEAEAGVAGVRAAISDAVGSLRDQLRVEPEQRRVAPRGVPMLLDEYLRTRFVEIAVHIEDLALSLEVEPPEVTLAVSEAAITVLVETAVLRNGAPAVLRALTRRERDDVGALRVF